MYRNFLTGLCAVAVVATGLTAVQAQTVDVSLNLRYNDPADPSEGGTWELVGKVDSGLGIAAVNAILSDVDNGIAPDDIALGGGIGAIDPVDVGGTPRPAYLALGTITDLIYGQDISVAAVAGVGTGFGTPGDNGADALLNSVWDNAALLASGSFSTGIRPTFTTTGSSSTDSNVFSSTVAPIGAAGATATTVTVRGDSIFSLGLETPGGAGLLRGDSDRDGDVDADDFNTLVLGFNGPGDWSTGDNNDTGIKDADDFNFLVLDFGDPFTPPTLVGATIPEPGTMLLCLAGTLAIFMSRRRIV